MGEKLRLAGLSKERREPGSERSEPSDRCFPRPKGGPVRRVLFSCRHLSPRGARGDFASELRWRGASPFGVGGFGSGWDERSGIACLPASGRPFPACAGSPRSAPGWLLGRVILPAVPEAVVASSEVGVGQDRCFRRGVCGVSESRFGEGVDFERWRGLERGKIKTISRQGRPTPSFKRTPELSSPLGAFERPCLRGPASACTGRRLIRLR
jgi:hypothetical protein